MADVDLAAAWHEQTEREVEAAYGLGYTRALEDIATGAADLDACWRPVGRQRHLERVAQRHVLFAVCANKLAEQMGRPGYSYDGGPVDFETGRPARRLEVAA